MARADGWYPPTVASREGVPPATVLRCPGCRRRVPAEMLYEVPGHGDRCDACRETLFRTGQLGRAEHFRAIGAPVNLVRRYEMP